MSAVRNTAPADFTFLEVHLDDATITNNAPYRGSDGPADGEREGSGGPSPLGLLVVAALAVRKVRAGGDEDASDLI